MSHCEDKRMKTTRENGWGFENKPRSVKSSSGCLLFEGREGLKASRDAYGIRKRPLKLGCALFFDEPLCI